jgi:hypothetical protein
MELTIRAEILSQAPGRWKLVAKGVTGKKVEADCDTKLY